MLATGIIKPKNLKGEPGLIRDGKMTVAADSPFQIPWIEHKP